MKRDVRYCLEPFLFFDYAGIEARLTAMAARGWRLEKIGRHFWKYRRAEPARVRYAVTYVPEATEYAPLPVEEALQMEEYCTAESWEKVEEWSQMQIFCTEDETLTPIETDEEVRLAVIHRTMKKSFLPAQIGVLCVVGLVLLMPPLWFISYDPVPTIADGASLYILFLYFLVVLLEAVSLAVYEQWYCQSKRAVARGGICAPVGPWRTANKVMVYALDASFLWFVAVMVGQDRKMGVMFLIAGGLLAAGWLVVQRVHNWLRKRGTRASDTFEYGVMVAMALAVGIQFLSNGIQNTEWMSKTEIIVDQYGREVRIHHDELPLTVEELGQGDMFQYVDYDRDMIVDTSSLMLGYSRAWQGSHTNQSAPSLEYKVIKVHMPFLYDLCLSSFTKNRTYDVLRTGDEYRAADPAPWGVAEAYQLYDGGTPVNVWVVAGERRMARMEWSWTPTAEQMALAGQRLLEA